jgi:hypothetical protein
MTVAAVGVVPVVAVGVVVSMGRPCWNSFVAPAAQERRRIKRK